MEQASVELVLTFLAQVPYNFKLADEWNKFNSPNETTPLSPLFQETEDLNAQYFDDQRAGQEEFLWLFNWDVQVVHDAKVKGAFIRNFLHLELVTQCFLWNPQQLVQIKHKTEGDQADGFSVKVGGFSVKLGSKSLTLLCL